MADKHGIETKFEAKGDVLQLAEETRISLYRTTRELLMNIIKHAKAKKVKVTVENIDETVRITVEDDGVGFDITKTRKGYKSSGGLGLFTVRERVRHLGGSLEINSEPNKGCRITVATKLTNDNDKELTV